MAVVRQGLSFCFVAVYYSVGFVNQHTFSVQTEFCSAGCASDFCGVVQGSANIAPKHYFELIHHMTTSSFLRF